MQRLDWNGDWQYARSGEDYRNIRLPHDAMQEQDRRQEAMTGTGGAFYEGGVYEYRKYFTVPKEWEGKKLTAEFEGVYPRAELWLNGGKLGECHYGYSGYFFSLDGVKAGEENELRVKVDHTSIPDSRWYPGSGIYRPVWLWVGESVHIAPEGVRVKTLSIGEPARVEVSVELEGLAATPEARESAGLPGQRGISEIPEAGESAGLPEHGGTSEVRESKEVSETETAAGGTAEIGEYSLYLEISFKGKQVAVREAAIEGARKTIEIEIPKAELWSAENPGLYECKAVLKKRNEILDEAKARFGIRTLSWSEKGFFVNGKETLLKGGCVHHDNGILGARSFAVSEYRRVKKLKDFGFNAIRSAHNPARKAMLDACDELGMYVMDEAWDMWYEHKTDGDYAGRYMEHYAEDVRAMVAKDYNHPCVVLYSIGNEVTEPAEEKGLALGKELIELFHREDASRPVTAGINIMLVFMAAMKKGLIQVPPELAASMEGNRNTDKMDSTAYNEMVSAFGKRMNQAAMMEPADEASAPFLDALDIAGYNYANSRYGIEGEKHPGRIVVGSETFPSDLAENWAQVEKLPYLIGDFMWTAWDYLGEVGLGAWYYEDHPEGFEKKYPWLLADSGAFDILGNDTAEAGAASVIWGKRETPYIGVCPVNHPEQQLVKAIWRGTNALPHWSYSGCQGCPATVEVYSAAPWVELFLNDRSLGKKETNNYIAVFETSYEPGTLRAVALSEAGERLSESQLQSADGELHIDIRREALPETWQEKEEILYFDISLRGSNGQVECNRDRKLTVSVEGGELLAFGSANPRTEERFLDGSYTTYYGRSQAVVRKGEGAVRLRVSGEGLEAVTDEDK